MPALTRVESLHIRDLAVILTAGALNSIGSITRDVAPADDNGDHKCTFWTKVFSKTDIIFVNCRLFGPKITHFGDSFISVHNISDFWQPNYSVTDKAGQTVGLYEWVGLFHIGGNTLHTANVTGI